MLKPDLCERSGLARRDLRERKLLNCRVEQTIEIEFGTKVQEHAAEADRGAIHEHELARYGDRTLLAQRLMHSERLAPAVLRRLDPIRDGAHAVVEERAVDEPCPNVERFDQVAVEAAKTPGLVGVHDERLIPVEQPVVEIDYPADEPGGENANTAVVEEIDPPRFAIGHERRVVAEVRIAVNDTVAAERIPPCLEHRGRELVADREVVALVGQKLGAVEPVERE